jgi:hypothetical protein
MRALLKETKKDQGLLFSVIITLLFLTFLFLNILHHEMWRDELQAWLIGRDSISVFELLFRNMRYEGHPALWHLALFFITRFTDNPFVMQILNVLISGAAVFLFLRYSPFNRLQKVLFVFGYFTLFEYGTISRNYAVGLLFIFAAIAIYLSKHRHKTVFTAITLFLLSQTNVYALMLSIALSGYFFLDHLFDSEKRSEIGRRKVQYTAAVTIILVGFALSVLQLVPPSDSGYATGWNTGWDPAKAFSLMGTFHRAYIPIPQNTFHFWDTNFIGSKSICIIISFLLFVFVVRVLKRTRLELLLYLGGTLAILVFMYIKYYGFVRHYGHLFILLIVSLWLAKDKLKRVVSHDPVANNHVKPAISRLEKIFQNVVLTILLACNFYAGLLASCLDWRYVFSNGRAAAQYIKENGYEDGFLVGHPDYAAITVTGFLSKKVFYPRGERFGTFIILDNHRDKIDFFHVLNSIESVTRTQWKVTIIILNFFPHHPAMRKKLRLLASFTGSVVKNEQYYLWELVE